MYLNKTIFIAINNLAGQWAWLDFVGKFFGEWSAYFLVGLVVLYPIISRKRTAWIGAFLALFSAGVAKFIITDGIRFFYHHPRPILVMPIHQLFADVSKEYSFPSGHVTFFFALATVIYFFNKKLGVFLLVMSALMGIGRIFIGVHWPADILAGAFIGIVTGWLGVVFFEKIKSGLRR